MLGRSKLDRVLQISLKCPFPDLCWLRIQPSSSWLSWLQGLTHIQLVIQREDPEDFFFTKLLLSSHPLGIYWEQIQQNSSRAQLIDHYYQRIIKKCQKSLGLLLLPPQQEIGWLSLLISYRASDHEASSRRHCFPPLLDPSSL